MNDPTVILTHQARSLLLLSQRTLGDLLGISRRTVQRWDAGRSHPSPFDLQKLAHAVHPKDPSLAAKLAKAAGTTLEALGLARVPPASQPSPAPPAGPSPPALPALTTRHLVDIVVCAAAEALDVPPPAVRPVLLAAFRKAREVGLKVEDVEGALDAPRDLSGKDRAKNRR